MSKVVQASSAFIRIGSLGLKFAFSILLIKFYGMDFVGKYNIISGYSTLLTYLVGLEFYYYANRKTCSIDPEGKVRLLQSQLALYIIIYIIIIVPAFIYFHFKFHIGLLFVLLLILGHLDIEVYRVLFSIKLPVVGAVVSSISNGLWTIPLIVLFSFHHFPKIETIIGINIIFLIIAVFIGFWTIKEKTKFHFSFPWIDTKLIKEGLYTSLPILCSSMAYRGSELMGRFWLESSGGLAVSGIFSSFQIMASVTVIVVEAGVAVVVVPHLVEARERSQSDFTRLCRTYFRQIVVLGAGVTLIAILSMKYFLNIIHKSSLIPFIGSYYLLAISYFLLAITAFYTLFLYSTNQDRAIISINVASAVLNPILFFVLLSIFKQGLQGACYCLLVWSGFQLFAKAYYSHRRFSVFGP